MADVEQVTEPLAYHGEGPVWWPDHSGLRWVDLYAGDLLTLPATGGDVRRDHVSHILAAIRPRSCGGYVAATERGFALVGADGSRTSLGNLWSDPDIRMNDGACDPHGRFYCGSMTLDGTPRAALYRLNLNRSIDQVLDGIAISNGLAWTPDGTAAYYIDTATQRIDVFDYDPRHGFTNRHRHITIPADAGAPDGLTVDSGGGVWVALYGGGAVRHYRTDGTCDDQLSLPVRQVTACTLGGPALTDLYITTSCENNPNPESAAGAVFRASVRIQGLQAPGFGA